MKGELICTLVLAVIVPWGAVALIVLAIAGAP